MATCVTCEDGAEEMLVQINHALELVLWEEVRLSLGLSGGVVYLVLVEGCIVWGGCGAKPGEGLWLVDSKLLVWGKQSVTKSY